MIKQIKYKFILIKQTNNSLETGLYDSCREMLKEQQLIEQLEEQEQIKNISIIDINK